MVAATAGMDAAAAWMFSPAEAEDLAAAPPEARPGMFPRAWTRKEAACNATGRPLDTMRRRDTRSDIVQVDAGHGTADDLALHTVNEDTWTWSVAWPAGASAAGRRGSAAATVESAIETFEKPLAFGG